MTTTQWMSTPNSQTAAQFAAWAKGFSDALRAIGLVPHAFSPAINWATVTVPVSASSTNELVSPFEVFGLSDTLQSTHPIYIRIEYAGYGLNVAYPGVYVTIGKSVSPSGTLGGILLPRMNVYTNTFGGTVAYECYASSGDGSMCALVAFSGNTGASTAFILERSRDSSGAPTPDGISFAYNNSGHPLNTSSSMRGWRHLWTANYETGMANYGFIPVIVPVVVGGVRLGSGGSLALSAISPLFPWTCFAPGVIPWQSIGGVSWTDDPGGVFTGRISGADRIYRSIPLTNAHSGWGQGVGRLSTATTDDNSSAYVGLAILWE